MAKQYDFSDFDEPKSAPSSGYDFSDFDEAPKEEAPQDFSEQEVSQPEAFGVGAIQGSTLGTAPIASGIGGGLMDLAKGLGDTLGLTTDSQLEDGIPVEDLPSLSPELQAKLKGQKAAPIIMDEKKGLEGLMSEYYDSRDRMKGLQDASAAQHPFTTLAGNIAGSIPMAGATGIKVAANAGKLAKIAAGAKEGAKLGAATGFGSGDAKLLRDGEDDGLSGVLRETADSTVGGALVGGAIPAAVSTVKGVGGFLGDLPILKQVGTAFKGGRANIDLNEDSAGSAIKTYSEDLLNQIRSQFSKAGKTKANALDYADEVGVRVNAGETFQEVMDDIIQRGASSVDDQTEKVKLLKTFSELKNGPANKAADKLDLNRAKNIQKMEEKGLTLLDEQPTSANVQDLVPGSESTKNLSLSKQTFQKLGEDGAEGKLVTKLVQQAGDELPININKYDLENLSLRDLEQIIGEVNRHTGELSGPARTSTEKTARELAANLRSLSEDALSTAGQGSGNASLSKTFSALNRAGIDDNVLTGNQVRKDAMVDKLRNTVTAGNPINRQRMFQYLDESAPEGYKGFKEGAEFLNDFNDLAKQVKPLNSQTAVGVLGSAKNIGLTVANKSGKGYEKLVQMTEMPAEQLGQIAQKFGLSTNKAAQQYASPLLKASQAEGRKRSAILFGLYQQPAFREMYQKIGEDANDIILPVGTDREEQN